MRAELALRLMHPSDRALLAARLAEQRANRAAAVRVNQADHRRIERDLHDGAQARLTAVTMSLGRAKRKIASDPNAALALVEEAYGDAQQAITELRDLARGIQPPILIDRGLDAAISALTARTPIPVDVDIRLSERPPGAAQVVITRRDDRLMIDVSDDGDGGARLSSGVASPGSSTAPPR